MWRQRRQVQDGTVKSRAAWNGGGGGLGESPRNGGLDQALKLLGVEADIGLHGLVRNDAGDQGTVSN